MVWVVAIWAAVYGLAVPASTPPWLASTGVFSATACLEMPGVR